MRTVDVRVRFEGTVRVCCADHLSGKDATILAKKTALARLVATTENPDCGECLEEACQEFVHETNGRGNDEDFDAAKPDGVSGRWLAI
jgi:hypothetical protein